jgi:cytochrome c oxidase subunit 4
MAEHVVAKKTYVLIWIVLMVLTAVTAWASTINFGPFSPVVALLIASIKASLVVLFFMHVRYAGQHMVWVVIIAGVFWLIILLSLTMSDYLTRGWLPLAGK